MAVWDAGKLPYTFALGHGDSGIARLAPLETSLYMMFGPMLTLLAPSVALLCE